MIKTFYDDIGDFWHLHLPPACSGLIQHNNNISQNHSFTTTKALVDSFTINKTKKLCWVLTHPNIHQYYVLSQVVISTLMHHIASNTKLHNNSSIEVKHQGYNNLMLIEEYLPNCRITRWHDRKQVVSSPFALFFNRIA